MANKFNKITKNLMLVTLIILLLSSLTACGLFTGLTEISKVNIEQKSTWVDSDSDGIFEVELGKYALLEVGWDNSKIKSPTIKWYIQEDAREKELIESEVTTELKYQFTKRGKTVYTISAVVNDVESSNSYKFVVVDAQLDNPTITCTTVGLSLNQGIIQQNILDTLVDVDLVADSNFDDIDPELVITFAWSVKINDGAEQIISDATTNTFKYDVSLISSACRIEVTCALSHDGLEVPKKSSVILEFVEEYEVVNKVVVTSTNTKVADTYATYYVEGSISNPGKVNLSASSYPIGTNLSTACVWEKTDASGTTTLSDDSRSIQATLSYGKNLFVAYIDNVASRQIIVYSLNETDYNNKVSYMKDDFVWNGGYQDHYISTQQDFNDVVGYAVSLHTTNQHDIYINSSYIKDNFSQCLQIASTNGVDESGSFSFSYTSEHNYITLNSLEGLGEPSMSCPSTYTVTQEDVRVRYSANTSTRASLPIDSYTDTMNVSNSNQLFRAVSWGYKPVISSASIQSLYDKAREVLLTYVNDEMTDLEKVKVIYDWIIENIDYDQATLETSSEDPNKTDYNAFYLEGVFNDKCAVCDGKSKAFTLLCGMEGITSQRIMGYANKNLGDKKADWEAGTFTAKELTSGIGLSSGTPATSAQLLKLMSAYGWGHAWNKVLIDANNDGVKEWYVIDTTWGDISSKKSGHPTEITEFLSYDYFLKTDSEVESNHYSQQEQYDATTTYDAFANEFINIGGEDVSIVVTSKAELETIKTYCNANKGTKVLIKVVGSFSAISFGTGIGYMTFDSDAGIYYVYVD